LRHSHAVVGLIELVLKHEACHQRLALGELGALVCAAFEANELPVAVHDPDLSPQTRIATIVLNGHAQICAVLARHDATLAGLVGSKPAR
jgi:hypothetical protein